MIRVILFGALGKMGHFVSDVLDGQSDITIVAGVEHSHHSSIGKRLGEFPILADDEDLPDADVWIDFSIAGPALDHARHAAKLSKPLIIAATGFDDDGNRELQQLASQCPILLAPNLSSGIGVMDYLISIAARLLGDDFDTAIFEMHHTAKRDAPSGTARKLADTLIEHGKDPDVVSVRAGHAIGEHTVHFVGEDEELTINHRAWSRRAFSGTVPRAVRFIVGRDPALYTIRDLVSSLLDKKDSS
ncbi:MAG: dihydrodipicolinate reductase C-terminal domain-containing protein [Candidatus Electryoneaceae bacterium]|nr:dihydrodipicolinate reductase C-terminal domain-containing protein [Candidatus Electryoneaceae bacterium]